MHGAGSSCVSRVGAISRRSFVAGVALALLSACGAPEGQVGGAEADPGARSGAYGGVLIVPDATATEEKAAAYHRLISCLREGQGEYPDLESSLPEVFGEDTQSAFARFDQPPGWPMLDGSWTLQAYTERRTTYRSENGYPEERTTTRCEFEFTDGQKSETQSVTRMGENETTLEVRRFSYDDDGRELAAEYYGRGTEEDLVLHAAEYHDYDGGGRLLSHRTIREYDEDGEPTEWELREYELDEDGRTCREYVTESGDGEATSLVYVTTREVDDNGRTKRSETTVEGVIHERCTYEYDEDGRLISKAASGNGLSERFEYGYDTGGRLESFTSYVDDEGCGSSDFEYLDEWHRVVMKKMEGGGGERVYTSQYDSKGRLVFDLEPIRSTHLAHDGDDRVVVMEFYEEDALVRICHFAFDPDTGLLATCREVSGGYDEHETGVITGYSYVNKKTGERAAFDAIDDVPDLALDIANIVMPDMWEAGSLLAHDADNDASYSGALRNVDAISQAASLPSDDKLVLHDQTTNASDPTTREYWAGTWETYDGMVPGVTVLIDYLGGFSIDGNVWGGGGHAEINGTWDFVTNDGMAGITMEAQVNGSPSGDVFVMFAEGDGATFYHYEAMSPARKL